MTFRFPYFHKPKGVSATVHNLQPSGLLHRFYTEAINGNPQTVFYPSQWEDYLFGYIYNTSLPVKVQFFRRNFRTDEIIYVNSTFPNDTNLDYMIPISESKGIIMFDNPATFQVIIYEVDFIAGTVTARPNPYNYPSDWGGYWWFLGAADVNGDLRLVTVYAIDSGWSICNFIVYHEATNTWGLVEGPNGPEDYWYPNWYDQHGWCDLGEGTLAIVLDTTDFAGYAGSSAAYIFLINTNNHTGTTVQVPYQMNATPQAGDFWYDTSSFVAMAPDYGSESCYLMTVKYVWDDYNKGWKGYTQVIKIVNSGSWQVIHTFNTPSAYQSWDGNAFVLSYNDNKVIACYGDGGYIYFYDVTAQRDLFMTQTIDRYGDYNPMPSYLLDGVDDSIIWYKDVDWADIYDADLGGYNKATSQLWQPNHDIAATDPRNGHPLVDGWTWNGWDIDPPTLIYKGPGPRDQSNRSHYGLHLHAKASGPHVPAFTRGALVWSGTSLATDIAGVAITGLLPDKMYIATITNEYVSNNMQPDNKVWSSRFKLVRSDGSMFPQGDSYERGWGTEGGGGPITSAYSCLIPQVTLDSTPMAHGNYAASAVFISSLTGQDKLTVGDTPYWLADDEGELHFEVYEAVLSVPNDHLELSVSIPLIGNAIYRQYYYLAEAAQLFATNTMYGEPYGISDSFRLFFRLCFKDGTYREEFEDIDYYNSSYGRYYTIDSTPEDNGKEFDKIVIGAYLGSNCFFPFEVTIVISDVYVQAGDIPKETYIGRLSFNGIIEKLVDLDPFYSQVYTYSGIFPANLRPANQAVRWPSAYGYNPYIVFYGEGAAPPKKRFVPVVWN